jgi:dinuclear metal center YbgI/SA1388 family protein
VANRGSDPLPDGQPAPTLGDVVAVLDAAYPPETAQPWDAVGLVCGDPADPVRTVVLAVDPVAGVVDEAIEAGAQLLVVHHPLLLRGVHSVAATTAKGRLLHRLIRAGCALYVAHTNADVARPGVSDALARMLGLDDLQPLVPTPGSERLCLVTVVPAASVAAVLDAATGAGALELDGDRPVTSAGHAAADADADALAATSTAGVPGAEVRLELELPATAREAVLAAVRGAHPSAKPVLHVTQLVPTEVGTGIGRVGRLSEPTTLERFALAVAEALPHTPQGVRVSGDPAAEVQTVAVCGGSGDDLFDAVRASGADVYLTADLRHHPASEARESAAGGRPFLVDVAHWASEWPWLYGCADRLHRELAARGTDVETHVSVLSSDPWTLRLSSSGGVVR